MKTVSLVGVASYMPRRIVDNAFFEGGDPEQTPVVFRGVQQPFVAGRYHSLVVAEPLPESLEMAARTEDGTIMGVRHRTFPVHGVQFHPESVLTGEGRQLLRNFLEM